MKERFLSDRYFRREDTKLARAINRISQKGEKHRKSVTKRVLDNSIAIPSALFSFPAVLILGAAKTMEDGSRPFFTQERIGESGTSTRVIKIRSMVKDAEDQKVPNRPVGSKEDSRSTKFGGFLRKYDLDELPQLWQIFLGKMSLVGVRASNQETFNLMKEKQPEAFSKWEKAYKEGRPGLVSLHAIRDQHRKDDLRRQRYDRFYAQKASLGLDMYILYGFLRISLKTIFGKNK